MASFSSPAFADITFGPGVSLSEPDQNGWVEIIGDGQDSTSWHDTTFNLITVSGANNTETITSPLRINHKPLISHSQFSIQAANGGTLNIDGDLDFNVTANQISPHFDTQIGTYALYATGQSHLNLNGSNIFVEIRHNLSNVEDQLTSVGANGIYLNSQSTASVGQKGGTTRIWVLAGQPDLISAKGGSTITFQSTNNQLVGSIDMMDEVNLDFSSPGYSKGVQSQHGPLG